MIGLDRVSACCLFVISAAVSSAEDSSRKITADVLSNDQLAISGRYDRFERLLSQMADILGHEDPEHAELLRRAVSRGREEAISRQLAAIVEDLGQGNLGRATEKQGDVLESLASLLQLLQSEGRRSELEKEREYLNELVKDISNMLSQQRQARSRTQNSGAPSSAAPDQKESLDEADEILIDIKAHDRDSDAKSVADTVPESTENSHASNEELADRQAGDSEASSDSESPSDSSDAERGETSEDDSDDALSAESSPSDAESGKSESQQNSPNESESQSSSDQDTSAGSGNSASKGSGQWDPQTPGRDQVAQARQYMQEALEQLQQQLRDEALQNQDEAIHHLQEAIAELRKRLLQLREEEKEMILASLEARFQRMLALQTQIYDETVDLAATAVDSWLDTMFARCREVAQQQAELQLECEQTLGLLQEDGTSVAFVLSVEDISNDMQTITGRLRAWKVSTLTQSLETDIMEALKELIEATQREMQEMKSQDRQQQSRSDEMQKPPLVDLIAEIRVLRSLQLRINRRTSQVDQLLAQESGDSDDLVEQLAELTARQSRLVDSAAEMDQQIRERQRQ